MFAWSCGVKLIRSRYYLPSLFVFACPVVSFALLLGVLFVLLPYVALAGFDASLYEGRQGAIAGIGTRFEITDSEYVNVTLNSSEEIESILESVPEMVTLHINASESVLEAVLTISGLLPSTIYHKYEDSYQNHVAFSTDQFGVYSYVQDVSEPHLIFIQPRASTLFIRDDVVGGDCSSIGLWDADTKTCTLTTDVSETIEIANSGITLNGNGHRVVGESTGNGIFVDRDGFVVIKNLSVDNFVNGVFLNRSSGTSIQGNTIQTSRSFGVRALDSSAIAIENNMLESGYDTGAPFAPGGSFGIMVQGVALTARDFSVSGNELIGFRQGIITSDAVNPVVSDNRIFNTSEAGVWMSSTENAILRNNEMTGTGGLRIVGNPLVAGSDVWFEHNIDTSNTMNGKIIYYDRNTNGKVYDGDNEYPNAASLFCFRCSDAVFKNFSFSGQLAALHLVRSSGSRVSGNSFIGNGFALRLDTSAENFVANNTYDGNAIGIYFDNDSNNNVFEKNQILNALAYGVQGFRSDANIFRGNTFRENEISFDIRTTVDTLFYRNNFFDRPFRVFANDFSIDFNLNLPIGGNYWSQFDEVSEGCEDTNSDDICDRAFTVASETHRVFPGVDQYPWTHQVTFEPEPEEPEIDPLLLQYEPILLLHPDENYRPMNVEAFVGASSLWDDRGLLPDTLVKAESESNPVTLDNISVPGESEDWYLQFSGGSVSPKTFSTTTALEKYQSLVTDGDAVPTYYGYKMEDSFVDDEGILHEYIVLQYWYFYAFNDWQEYGGFNNHEGDWETVMVFLEKDTEEPRFVAYSAHHNDDDPTFDITQYDSVRRSWDSNEIEKNNSQVKSFVALGSHANYPNNGDNGERVVPVLTLEFIDQTSLEGIHLTSDVWNKRQNILSTLPEWIYKYEGKWGSDSLFFGSDGPQGPNFIAVGGTKRFHNPVEWAGIGKDSKKEITTSTDALTFVNQSTAMTFEESLSSGVISVSQHDELISYGSNLDAVDFLPHFWDLESNLGASMPTTTVTFSYGPEEVENFGIIERDLSIFLYNDGQNIWEEVDSVLDIQTSTISFITDHFSRYAIGARKWESIGDEVKIKKQLKKYNSKKGTRNATVRLKNKSGETIKGDIRLFVTSISKDGVYLINNTGTTTEGQPYIDITEEEYSKCKVDEDILEEIDDDGLNDEYGDEGEEDNDYDDGESVKSCTLLLSQYPELEGHITLGIAPGKKSVPIKFVFSLPIKKTFIDSDDDGEEGKVIYIPQFRKFDFEVEVQRQLEP